MKLYNWSKMDAETLSANITRRAIFGENLNIARVILKKGTVVPEHKHEAEQISLMISGELEMNLNGQISVLHPGDILVIPAWLPHSARAIEESDAIDIFSPRREDWLRGDDQYLRG